MAKRTLLFLAFAATSVCPIAAEVQPPTTTANARPLWHSLTPGPYEIGFRLLTTVDPRQPDGSQRPIRIGLWYPAERESGSRTMTWSEYLEVTPDQVLSADFENWMNSRDRESLARQFFTAEADAHQATLAAAEVPVAAGARPLAGPYPLVLHSLGRNGNQFQHTVLWEYLASHGFAVASVGQFGASLDDPEMEFSLDDLSIQLGDMEGALAALSTLPHVDAERTAVIGHSSGAVVALWLASRQPAVHAVVGLDGSVNRVENQKVFRGGLGERTVSAPFLNVCRWPHEEYDESYSASLVGPLTRIGFAKAIHFDFQNWPSYQALVNAKEPRSMAARSVDEAKTVFETSAVVTRLFLEARLKQEPAARSMLHDSEQIRQLSKGLATVTVQRP